MVNHQHLHTISAVFKPSPSSLARNAPSNAYQRTINGQTLANQCQNNAQTMPKQCGRGKHVLLKQDGSCNKLLIIHDSMPASPLQFIGF